MKKLFIGFSLFLGLAQVIGAWPVSAAGGITISPPFQNIDILPNQTSEAQSFAIANKDDTEITFALSTVDMGSLDETGGVVFSGLPAAYTEKYGVAQWVKLPQTTVTVPPRSVRNVNYEIRSDDHFAAGGHYGAIIVKPVKTAPLNEEQIRFDPQTALLLFVRKVGGEVYDLKLNQPSLGVRLWKLPASLAASFKNDGNVHVVPRGVVRVVDPGGKVVIQSIINSESSLILPERTRVYLAAFQPSGWWRLPGRYKVVVDYRYDGRADFTTIEQNFFFWNLPLILMGVAMLLTLVIAAWVIRRRYAEQLRRTLGKTRRRLLALAGKINPWGRLRSRRPSANPPSQTKSYVFWPTHRRGHPTAPPGERPKSPSQKL